MLRGCLLALVLASLSTGSALAAARWVEGTESTWLAPVVRDDARPRVYVGDCGHGQVLVVDEQTEKIVARIAAPQISRWNHGLAIDAAGKLMAIAGGKQITLVDLDTLAARTVSVATGDNSLYSVAFDQRGRLYAASGPFLGGQLMMVDPANGAILEGFGPSLQQPQIRVDWERKYLYVSEIGALPRVAQVYDVTGDKPEQKAEMTAAEQTGQFVSETLVGASYDVFALTGRGIEVLDEAFRERHVVTAGNYSHGIAQDPNAQNLYTVNNDRVYAFAMFDFAPTGVFQLNESAYGYENDCLAIGRAGRTAFVASHDSFDGARLQVVEVTTGRSEVQPLRRAAR